MLSFGIQHMESTIKGVFSGKKGVIIRYALLLVCVIAIVLALPKEIKFKFDFEKGRTWKHEDLNAPFDFAINKSPEEISVEKISILNSTHPYFKFNDSIVQRQLSSFKNDFNLAWEKERNNSNADFSAKKNMFSAGQSILQNLFDKGVILPTGKLSGQAIDFVVNVVRNNVSSEAEIDDFYTLDKAQKFLFEELGKMPPQESKFLKPLLENALTNNVFYDEESNTAALKELVDNISPTRGMVQAGENIIHKSELITPEKFKILSSLKAEYEGNSDHSRSSWALYVGYLILTLVCLLMLHLFLFYFRSDIFSDHLQVVFLTFLVCFMVIIHAWIFRRNMFSLYLLPYCILPVIVRTFFDTRLALFTHLIALLIIGLMAPNSFEFVFIQLIVGMVAIFSMVKLRNRSQLFFTSAFIMSAYGMIHIGISLIHEGSIENIDWYEMRFFIGNGLLFLFVYPLIMVFERVFGFISDMTLLELSNSNSLLLRELSLKAPGTFQHSLQVANLAEAAVQKIGGNSLLVRAGAMYHDIGKIDMPAYFIENLNAGANPHDDLSFDQSAQIIISHVEKGFDKARKAKIPAQILHFIRTHHGTTVVQYFYQSYLKNYPDRKVDVDQFRYPGPIPFSKEMAVLMMADSIEAASRSLQKTDMQSIQNLIDAIIENQISQKQFINAPITFREMDEIKKIFLKQLMSIHHTRIEYTV